MKRLKLIIATLIYFLIVNSGSYWESKLGAWAFPAFLLLALYFFVLSVFLIGQLYYSIKERFQDKQRLILITAMAAVLLQSLFYPALIDFKTIRKDIVLVGSIEGVANCTTTIELYDDNSFLRRGICFSVTEVTGRYHINGDTIFFHDIVLGRDVDKFYTHAIITNHNKGLKDFKGNLNLYENLSDTLGYPMLIIENNLFK